jgi:Ser/Thr protein kinase RdoA (MazF antagonist)
MHPIDAAVALGRRHGLESVEPRVLKDGSNLIVVLEPARVVVRVATLTGWVRGDPRPFLAREVALSGALAKAGANVAGPSDRVPPGPHEFAGWQMSVTAWIDHVAGRPPDAMSTLGALDALHAALDALAVPLPFLGPALGDLDAAWGRLTTIGILPESEVTRRRARRAVLVRRLVTAAPERRPLHGDAYPRNALVDPEGTVVWIDFEDACVGPAAWDHAILIRQGGDPAIEPILRARDGDAAIDAAMELRGLQAEAWTLIHDARAAGRLPIPASYARPRSA